MRTAFQRFTAFGCSLSWVVLLLGCGGCVTSRMAADRIVTAPNLNGDPAGNWQMLALWQKLETNLLSGRIATPLLYTSVPVGPPAAELKVLQLPAQDYHLTISNTVTFRQKGEFSASLNIVTNTGINFKPRAQPATLILLHGYMLAKETMLPWALHLAQAGYRVVLVDLRGHGQSTGDQVGFGKFEVNDLRQLLDGLQARGACDETVGVMGFLYGATLALHWAAQDERIRTVVALALVQSTQ
ncbi:MAG: alpha/beta fold hydrolase [Verrucomicrobiota bacterium]